MKRPDSFYLTTYRFYKTLPKLALVATAIISLVMAITDSNRRSSMFGGYGIMGADSSEEAFFGWVVIGALACGMVYIFTTVQIAPIILQTDALIALQETMCSDDEEDKNDEDDQPAPKKEYVINYECEYVRESGQTKTGKCLVCGKLHSNLEYCIIKNRMGKRELYICPDCKEKFQQKSLKRNVEDNFENIASRIRNTATGVYNDIKSSSPEPKSNEKTAWRCSCGMVNGPSARYCSSCFKSKPNEE